MASKTSQYNLALKEDFTAKLRDIDARMQDMHTTMKKTNKVADEGFNFIKSGVILAGVGKLIDIVKDFGVESIRAFGDYQEKLLRMEAQTKVSASNLGLSFQQLKDLSNELESSSGIDDSKILDAMSLMQTFTNVRGEVFKQSIEQSTNLTAVFGDIGTAANQLGMALNDPIEGLGKLEKAHIKFTDAEKDHYRLLVESGHLDTAQLEILAKVKTQYDGLAETLNTGVNGSIRGLANSWDETMKNFGESFSKFALPVINQMTNALNQLNSQSVFSKITPQQEKAVQSIYGKVQGLGSIRDPETLKSAEESIRKDIDALEKSGYSLTNVLAAVQTQRQAQIDIANTVGRELSEKDRANTTWMQEANRLAKWETLLTSVRSERDTIQTKDSFSATAEANNALKTNVVPTGKVPDFKGLQNTLANDASLNLSVGLVFDEGVIKSQVKQQQDLITAQQVDYYNSDEYAGLMLGKELLSDKSPINMDSLKKANAELDALQSSLRNPMQAFFEDLDKKIKESISGIESFISSISPLTNAIGSLFSTLSSIQLSNQQSELDTMRSNFDEWKAQQDLKIQIAKSNGDATNQMEQDLANESFAKNKEIADKEREVKKKTWQAQKDAQLSQIVMSTATAVMQAYSGTPFPFSIPFALAVGGIGLAEFSAVANTQMPAFAGGGIVPGSSTSGDNVIARLNSKEMVLTQTQQANLFNIANGNQVSQSNVRNSNQVSQAPQVIYQVGPVYGTIDPSFIETLIKAQARYEFVGA